MGGGYEVGNLWLDKGNIVLIKYFHHEFKAKIIGFGRLGVTAQPLVEEPWMKEYEENQFDGIKPGCLLVDYTCVREVISHK